MRWREYRDRVEQEVYESMEELAEILGLTITEYPDVWWLGRSIKVDDLRLPQHLLEVLREDSRVQSRYFYRQKIVLITAGATRHAILEESTHALHLLSNPVSYANKDFNNTVCLRLLLEMIGFLGAKILGSDLQNPYEQFPDLTKIIDVNQHQFSRVASNFNNFHELFAYQQGYGLADRIYFQYLAGAVTARQIRGLFLFNLNPPAAPLKKFIQLRKTFWPDSG